MWSLTKIYEVLLKLYTVVLAGSKSNEEIVIDLLEANKQLAQTNKQLAHIDLNTQQNKDIASSLLEVVAQLTAMNKTLTHIDSLLTNPPAPPVIGIGVVPGPVTEHS